MKISSFGESYSWLSSIKTRSLATAGIVHVVCHYNIGISVQLLQH